jgi:hypothetical protein
MARIRVLAFAGVVAALATTIVMSLAPAGAAPAKTIRGVIGTDVEGVPGLTDGGDWGAVATVPGGADTRLSDTDVAVDSVLPDAATDGEPVSVGDATDHACTGTWRAPTAPPDTVCIYIANADNAVDIRGVSISPGSGGVRWGFKLVWSHSTNLEDSFVDATWAYTRPAS